MAFQNLKPNILFLLKSLFSFSAFLVACTLHASEIRIVSLSPAITEVLFDLGLESKIVGTSSFSNFPDQARKIPTVGSYLSPSIEKIVRLKPTHVLVFKEGDPSIEQSLKNANLNYIVLDSRTLADFENMILKLGTTFAVEKKSREILKVWKSQWEMLASIPKVEKKMMIQVDHNPIFIAGKDTFISKAFEKCGLKNSFDNVDGYKKVQTESVMNRKPDVILVVGMLNQNDSFKEAKNFWNSNPVTKTASVIQGDGDILSRLSARLPSEVIKTCTALRKL